MTDYLNHKLYGQHLQVLNKRYTRISEKTGVEGLALLSGSTTMYFADDQHPPFHSNPHFLQWLPWVDSENSAIIWEPGRRPRLLFHSPKDYWYQPSYPQDWMEENFDVTVYEDPKEIWKVVEGWHAANPYTLLVGPTPDSAVVSKQKLQNASSSNVLNQMNYMRAYKTDFELDCMVTATRVGVRGHIAARSAFFANGSEYDIHMAYLQASQQIDSRTPYASIVALNEHAAVIHYQHYERERSHQNRSLLIDAGGSHCCFGSDITRTYAFENGEFLSLIEAVNERQQQLIKALIPSTNWLEVHEKMHHLIAEVLVEQGILKCSPESAFEQQLTDVFFPHGIGHLLGLQTHDVGGQLNKEGREVAPPERYPSLRLTRNLDARMVVTVEPGLYFIPILLDKIRGHKDVSWSKVGDMLPYGGIRIEDNVYFDDDGSLVNLTRNAFNELDD